MSSVTADVTTDLRVDARRARFRDAVGGLAQKARSGDLLRLLVLPSAVLVTGGFAFMLLGWWGAAHTHREIEQIPYLISGGLVGLGMVLLGGLLLATAVWLSALQRMQERMVAAIPPPPAPKPRAPRKKAAA
jgi:hypothetical protein